MKAPSKPVANLPHPPSLWHTVGPSFILLGLALGSGELILWPYLSATHGLGLLWGAALGISFQFVLNTEVMRYSLAWGESIFVGFRKLGSWWPLWFIISTLVPWSLPGFSSAASEILHTLLPAVPANVFTVAMLILTGVLLTAGKTLYQTMEWFEKVIVLMSVPFIAVLWSLTLSPVDVGPVVAGLLGQGQGWWFFPPGLALGSFLGAFAYSGAGGNLNLTQSHYIKEKGFGMGAYAPKITSLLAGGNQAVRVEGQLFTDSPHNRSLWQRWWRLVTWEHGIVFWFTGLLTIVMLSSLAWKLTYGMPLPSGLGFIFVEAAQMNQVLHPRVGTLFLVATALMLFSTQVIVLEAASRIISENALLLFYKKGNRFNLSRAFYIALWVQIVFGIILLFSGFKEPRYVLTLAAVFNAMAMMIAFPLVWRLNTTQLRVAEQPISWRRAVLLIAFGFFVFFVAITLRDFQI